MATAIIGMHRKLDELVFRLYVKESTTAKTDYMLGIKRLLVEFRGKYNEYFFNEKYCIEYAMSQVDKFSKNSSRKIGLKKYSTLQETILMFFHHRKSNEVFIPQKNFAEAHSVTQKTVSVTLKSMVEHGFIVLKKRGSSYTGQASVYSVCEKGLEVINSILGIVKKVVVNTVEKAEKTMYKMKNFLAEKSKFLIVSDKDDSFIAQRKALRSEIDEDRPFKGNPMEEELMEMHKKTMEFLKNPVEGSFMKQFVDDDIPF